MAGGAGLGILSLPVPRLDLGGGSFCFHFLTNATEPKMNSVLEEIRAWAQLPSGSSKESERGETAPSLYEEGDLTQEG
jgi:hypothetical protein